MPVKKYDAVVTVGKYQKDGETKNRYLTVGSVLEGDDGGLFMVLDRAFNPAGVINPENRSTVLINLYTPRPRQQQQDGITPPPQQNTPPQDNGGFDDDIPF